MATSKKDRDKLSPIYELMDNGELLTTEQFEELKKRHWLQTKIPLWFTDFWRRIF